MDNYLNISSLIAFEDSTWPLPKSIKIFCKLDNGKAGCKSCGRHLVTLGGNSTGLVRHLDLNHKAMMATFEEKKKQRDETRKRKTPSAGQENPSPKRPKEDFFKKTNTVG